MDYQFIDPEKLTNLYPEDEGEIVRAAQHDQAAFLLLFRHYLGPVYRYHYQRAGNTPAAEELTARTLLAMRAGLSGYREKVPFAAWLFAQARHAAESQLRRQPAAPPRPLHLRAGDEDLAMLAELIERLDPGERELIYLRYAGELSPAAIAHLFRRKPEAVESALDDILQRTLAGLRDYDLEPPSDGRPWVERRLQRLYALAEADAEFAARLEGQALAADVTRPPRLEDRLRRALARVRTRAWTVLLGGLIVLALPVLMVGPQQILIAAQALAVQMPWVRYINLDGTRVLAEPVVVDRRGTTVAVTRFIAHADGTLVVFETSGLPELQGGADVPASLIRLRLPNGNLLVPLRTELRPGSARLEFPAIPLDVMNVTLSIDRLPLVPENMRPEDWQIDLPLRKANAADPNERLPVAYTPEENAASRYGIQMEVLQVSEGPDEIALRLQVDSEDPEWQIDYSPLDLTLQDDAGRALQPGYGSAGSGTVIVVEDEQRLVGPFGLAVTGSEDNTSGRTLRYAPLALPSERLRLQLSSLMINAPVTKSFLFDPGPNPYSGQRWELDIPIDLGVTQGRVTEAVYYYGTYNRGWRQRAYHRLTFEIEFPADPDRRVETLRYSLEGDSHLYGAELHSQGTAARMEVRMRTLPDGPITVTLHEVGMCIHGDWAVEWSPRLQPPAEPQKVYHLSNVSTSINGLALGVEEITLTGQATLLRLNVSGLPEGMSVAQIFSNFEYGPKLYLEDDRGRRYRSLWSSPWQLGAASDFDPLILAFEPLAEDIQSLQLSIPGIEIKRAEPIDLPITIPDDLTFDHFLFDVTSHRGGEHVTTLSSLSQSKSWPVDARLDAGRYWIFFDVAALRSDILRIHNFSLVLNGSMQPGEFGTGALEVLSIRAPDGQVWPGNESYSMVAQGNGLTQYIDLNTGRMEEIQRGEYQIELGISFVARGPWQIDWNME
ncbi:MAG TPA: sigma factor [Anaerolineaceae bacterium]|nr:sigma factor [Anaerolineaceae bacterium]